MNTATFYFSPTPEDQKDENVFGPQYQFKLQVDDEGDGNGSFKVTDTIGRYLPFDFEHLTDLIDALILVETAVTLAKEHDFTESAIRRNGLFA